MYKVTMSVKSADFHFERSAGKISIGEDEVEYPYLIEGKNLVANYATEECVNAILSLGIQVKVTPILVKPATLEAKIKKLEAENEMLRRGLVSLSNSSKKLANEYITIEEATNNALCYARDKAHNQLKRIYEITME